MTGARFQPLRLNGTLAGLRVAEIGPDGALQDNLYLIDRHTGRPLAGVFDGSQSTTRHLTSAPALPSSEPACPPLDLD